jgi:signal transduction histidine kinase
MKMFLQVLWRRLKKLSRFFLHPIVVFIILQVVSVTLTVLWVIWYVNQKSVRFVNTYDVTFLIAGCLLTGIILLGTVLLFTFAIKQSRLNKQQRSFVSSVTHELRSPIASIQLSLETLAGRKLSPETECRLFEMIHTDLDRLVNLVDQILVSARLDRGIRVFEVEDAFSLREVIVSATHHVNHLDQKIEKRVIINCDQNLMMKSAKGAVSLILNNLLENAVKYSPKASAITITAALDSDHVVISFTDLGFGIDKSEQKKIFKIFSRGEFATKKAIPGTGLGLYIVKSVVGVLGGSIKVYSIGRGLGSTFVVRLPIEDTYRELTTR